MKCKNKSINKILLMMLILVNIFVLNTNVFAFDMKIKDIRIVEQSGSISVNEPVIENNEIKTNIIFNEINDFVTYELEIENNDNKKYTVESILDDNKNKNISIIYETETKEVKENDSLKIRIKIKYDQELLNVKTLSLEDITMKIKLVREDGKEKTIVINNPKTGDGIVKYFILLMVLLIGILYKQRNRKVGVSLLLLSIIIFPFVTFANEVNEIKIKLNNIKINGYMIPYEIKYHYNNGDDTKIIVRKYGEELGELESPEKEGYEFIGWFNKDEEVTKETIVTKEMTLEAKYSIILYSINYELNGGVLDEENPNIYTVEDEITLNNPTKMGYTFIGWTGSNGSAPCINVKIEKGTIESKEYTANYAPNTDTPYKVIHKQMNLDGKTYKVVEEENLEGTTDTSVTPKVNTYTGFKSPEEVTVNIDGDGSTVVEYLYERKKYELTIEDTKYLTDDSASSGKYYYKEEIILKAKEIPGYTFVSWSDGETNPNYTFKLTGNKTIHLLYEANTDTPYKVIHKQMNLDGSTYTEKDTEELTGTTDTEVTPKVNTYTGFKSPEEVTVKIDGDGSTVVEYLYERKKYELTIEDTKYLTDDSASSGKYYYKEEITIKAKTRPGYTFVSWSDGETNPNYTFKLTGNKEIKPVYTSNKDTAYRVIHKQMNINGEGYTEKDTEVFTGETDTEVTPSVKTYTGFTSPNTQTVNINGDGSTIVEYLYARNKYTLTVERDNLEEESTPNGEYYYKEEITLKAKEIPGYTFTKWSDGETNPNYTFKLTENKEISPEYMANTDTKYTVIHKQMNINGEGYTEKDTEVFEGTTDTEVTPNVKTYTGFTSPNTQTVNINGDGSTIVEYLYTRNKYTLTVERENLEEESTPNGEYYYKEEITLKAKEIPGYTFVSWSDGETNPNYTFKLTENKEISPEYMANTDTKYTVIHKQMNINGEGYTEKEREVFTGETDSLVTPNVKTYTGFTSPNTQTVNINGDGSTTVEYLYTRNKYTLTVEDRTYIDEDSSNINGEYYYGTSVTLTAKPKIGYDFEWNDGVTTYENTFEISGDKILRLIYTPRDDIKYKVLHKLMNSDGQTYYVKDEYDNEGIADSLITPPVNIYEGFTSPEAKEVTIKPDGTLVVEYLYTRNKYTFNIEDKKYVDIDNSTSDGEYYYGTEVHALAKEREGYTFVKWSNDDTSLETTFNLIENTNITPIYVANLDTPYKVIHKKMNLDGETYTVDKIENFVGETDTKVTPSVKTYTGFTSPEEVTVNIDGDGSRVVEYLYTRNKYRLEVSNEFITSNLDNGDYYYETEVKLVAEEREGYTFVSWSDGHNSLTYNFNLTSDKTLSVIYSTNTDTPYTVIHKQMSLEGVYLETEREVFTGETDTTVIPERKIYEHYISPEGQSLIIKGNGQSSIDYLYEREKYKLEYSNKENIDLTSSTTEGNYYYETEITVKAKNKTGYNFSKWSNGALSQEYKFNINENVSLEPIYDPIIYTVSFNSNGGEGIMDNQQITYDTKTNISNNTFTKTGYHFKEWNTLSNGNGDSYSNEEEVKNLTTNTSITLYAIWEPNTNTKYKVIHKKMNIDGSTYSVFEEETKEGTTDTEVIPEVKTYTGFESPSTSALTIKADGTGEITYFYTRNQYTVSYNSKGGSLVSNVTKYYEDTLGTLSTPTRTGYTFDGWYTEELGGTQISTTTSVTEDITYYAHWTINKIYIKLDMNNGSLSSSHGNNIGTSNTLVTVDNSTNIHVMNYGESLGNDGLANYNNSSYINIVRTGYVAKANEEWNTSSNGTGTSFNQNTNYDASNFCDASVNSCSITLYVNWQPQKVTVSFYKNGGTGTDGQAQTFTYGVSNQSFANKNFSRSGYQMLGWNESSTATTAAYSTTSGVADSWINSKCGSNATCSVNLYAIWKQNSVTCSSGKYLPANTLTCQSCTAGYRCSGGTYNQSSSIQGRTQCKAGTFSTGGASSCTACANGSYSSSNGATSCTACAAGKTNSGTGNTSCSSNCSNSAGVASWKTPSWSNNSTSNLCTANSCSKGYKGSGTGCTKRITDYYLQSNFGVHYDHACKVSQNIESTWTNIGSTRHKYVEYGSTFGTLPTPTASGYTFLGWYYCETQPTSSTTLPESSVSKNVISDSWCLSNAGSYRYQNAPFIYYADIYPDLYNAFGYNYTSLKNHYYNNGINEGRRISQITSSTVNTSLESTIYLCPGFDKN